MSFAASSPKPEVRRAHSARYIGRFAPSPSGPLHFGSLIAAVGSYLQARVADGEWHIRIDDLDTPRVVPGAADDILRTLEAYGFKWHSVVYQSRRLELYRAALAQLQTDGRIYACTCSRAQLAEEQRYPGTCRPRRLPFTDAALRFIVDPGVVTFIDRVQGEFSDDVAASLGDFIVRRRDGIFAYHLASVVDDAAQGMTEVVRGADLLDSTPRQILLQRALGLVTPSYAHLPLAIDAEGRKLSKSVQSVAIDTGRAVEVLSQALSFLGHPPPAYSDSALSELWTWAKAHWDFRHLRHVRSGLAPEPVRST